MPTAVLVSDPFLALARGECAGLGMHDLPIVRVPHPVGERPVHELRAIAASVADLVIEALRSGGTPPTNGEQTSDAGAEIGPTANRG